MNPCTPPRQGLCLRRVRTLIGMPAALLLVFGLATASLAAQPADPAADPALTPAAERAATIQTLDTEVPPAGEEEETPFESEPVMTLDAGDGDPVSPGQYRANNAWVLFAAALVFLMHLGFTTLESGLTRAKNAVNIVAKNVFIICAGILSYWVWGFGAHYPGEMGDAESLWLIDGVLSYGMPLDVATGAAGATNMSAAYYEGGYTAYTDFIFQAMFAATAATIVSGAVAERIKLAPFFVFALVFVAFGYPFVGSWHWGEGWLAENGFYDFAGSSVVHAFGGFGALAGVLLLGPRLGKYAPDGSPRAIPGHNIPLAAIGVFLLFLGWFGFNGGSVLSATESSIDADGNIAPGIDFVFVTTALAGASGGFFALFTSWIYSRKPDVTMALNGMLAGLVGITAGADVISPGMSIVVGGIAGVIVVFSVIGLDRIGIDDPVGAISVHGVCGIWGTIAVGLFAMSHVEVSLMWQVIGTLVVSGTAFLIALSIFGILKVAGGIRVSEQEEIEGLDAGEHGMHAYPDFAVESYSTPGLITTPARQI